MASPIGGNPRVPWGLGWDPMDRTRTEKSANQPRAANGQFGSGGVVATPKPKGGGGVAAEIAKLQVKLTKLQGKLKSLQQAGTVHHGNHGPRLTHQRSKKAPTPKGVSKPKGAAGASKPAKGGGKAKGQSTAAQIAHVQAKIAQVQAKIAQLQAKQK